MEESSVSAASCIRRRAATPRAAARLGLTLSAAVCLLAAAVSGCAGVEQRVEAQQVSEVENELRAADFVVHKADSPAKLDYLRGMAPFAMRYEVDRRGGWHFFLADPEHCKCLFEGDQAAYQRYQKIRRAEQRDRRQAEQVSARQAYRWREQLCYNPPYFGYGFPCL